MPWILLYVAAFGSALFLGAIFTWLSRGLADRWGIMDRPGGRKAHARPIPTTGGWGVFASFALIAGGGGLIAPLLAPSLPASWAPLPEYMKNLAGMRRELGAILFGTTFIFVVGAVDDLRPLGPRVKLLAQFLAVVPLLIAGIQIRLFLPTPVPGMILTALWVVFLMNSLNFIDNMDGLCATVACTITVVLAIAAGQGGQLWMPALFLSFAGTLAGFLIFNFHPASIFLGDSGALVIGYLLGVFSIMTTFYGAGEASGLPVLIPLAVMGVPLFDTASVMLIRWRAGKPLMVGDRNHFSHRLQALGFSVRQTAVTIGLLTGAIGLSALPLRYLSLLWALVHLLALAMLFGVIAAIEFAGRSRSND